MSRPAVALIALSCTLFAGLVLAGCGGSGRSFTLTCPGATRPASDAKLLSLAGSQPIGVVPGTEDFQAGCNRYSFLIIDQQSRAISTPTASVWVSTGLKSVPFERTVASLEPVGVAGGAKGPMSSIFVTHVDLPGPGKYWLLAVPTGSKTVGALANLIVPKHSTGAPRVGDRAIPSKTPTLASTGGKLSLVSTATHPDPRLYRISVAQALAQHVPFVLTFATPKFCTSRTCGPIVDTVDAVSHRLASTPVRFIHVEIYEDNDPAKGFNDWVKQWKLPTEPWTFLVDRKGVIRARLEGAFSADELERTIRATLLGSTVS
jgi:hypothetical protein